MFATLATATLCNVSSLAAWIFQEQPIGWDPISLWHQMNWAARIVVIILFIMSGWSIGVMIDRWMAFNAARKQSRAFAPAVAAPCAMAKLTKPLNWRSATRRLIWRK